MGWKIARAAGITNQMKSWIVSTKLCNSVDVTPLEHGLIVDVRTEAEERAGIMNDRV
jgi:hypothetical protein